MPTGTKNQWLAGSATLQTPSIEAHGDRYANLLCTVSALLGLKFRSGVCW